MKKNVGKVLSIVLAVSLMLSLMGQLVPKAEAAAGQKYIDVELSEEVLTKRINTLYSKIGGRYLTANGKACTNVWEANHSCGNCLTRNIVKSRTFKSIFGDISYNQFYITNGWSYSCQGAVEQMSHFIFKVNDDSVIIRKLINGGKKVAFTRSNAEKYGVTVGTVLRLGEHHTALVCQATDTGLWLLHSNYGSGGGGNCKVTKDFVAYGTVFDTIRIYKFYSRTPLNMKAAGTYRVSAKIGTYFHAGAPLADATVAYSRKYNQAFTVRGSIENFYGNVWLLTSDGRYTPASKSVKIR